MNRSLLGREGRHRACPLTGGMLGLGRGESQGSPPIPGDIPTAARLR